MKVHTYIVILIIVFSNTKKLKAQIDSPRSNRKNILHLEIAGGGSFGSVNYERVFTILPRFSFSGRLGLSSVRIKGSENSINPDFIVPVTLYCAYGKKHRVELGVGETVSNGVEYHFHNGDQKRQTYLITHFSLGYSYFNPSDRLFFRCAYVPLYKFNRKLQHWFGVSGGFIF